MPIPGPPRVLTLITSFWTFKDLAAVSQLSGSFYELAERDLESRPRREPEPEQDPADRRE